VQIAGDGRGGAIHLFERECTLQRRHQKLIEEAPSAGLAPALREAMLADACRLAAGVAYRGLGTVEFIVGAGEYHFLEVNPRLQVEHPVTEAVTGLDLVELQLRIADVGRLPLAQAEVRCSGHAFEARVCAEDVAAGFLPATGRIELARFPGPPLRVESAIESGDVVSGRYDSMLAKLIAHGATREAALSGLDAGLRDTVLLGVPSNVHFLRRLLALPETRASSFHTRLIDERFGAGDAGPEPAVPLEHLCAAALFWLERQRRAAGFGCWGEWQGFTGWRLAGATREPAAQPSLRLQVGARQWPVRFARPDAQGRMTLAIEGERRHAALQALGAERYLLHADETALQLSLCGDASRVHIASPLGAHGFDCLPWLGGATLDASPSAQLVAPMMGRVVALRAAPGEALRTGQTVVVLESMKMELHVNAACDARLQSLECALGDMVERGAVLARLEAETTR
jgi:3-methylcrotonyl-CoA carboxylase alpha subunit